ncbi:MAG: DUF4395 family protein [Propionibacteriales bacterium]|nr:DUF4395 family protein [Propionibacteriales bacterium]
MSGASQPPPTDYLDPRGPRFAAALTSIVLAVVLLTASVWLLALQAVVFAVGAIAGVRRSPYSLLYARLIRPRLSPPKDWEAPRPPQFAQAVGLVFALVGIAGFALGAPVVGLVATALALVAALLNAVTGFCLGCEIYLLIQRITSTSTHDSHHTTEVSA